MTADMMECLRLHIKTTHTAALGANGKNYGIFEKLNEIKSFAVMKVDLMETYEDAHDLTMMVLKHEAGEFHPLEKLNTLVGIETLTGFEQTLVETNKTTGFPKEEIQTMEDDLLCRMSVIFIMLDFVLQRLATIIKSNVRMT